MASKSKSSDKTAVMNGDNQARRRFLAACGRLSIATPPAVVLLLANSERSYAQVSSGGSTSGSSRRRGLRIFGIRIG
jgi:hypothetical protein